MGFYGTADLIGWCQERAWDYRLRLKGNLVVIDGTDRTTTGKCARVYSLENVELTGRRARTHIGIIHDPGHAEPWIIAMYRFALPKAPEPPALLNLKHCCEHRWCSEIRILASPDYA